MIRLRWDMSQILAALEAATAAACSRVVQPTTHAIHEPINGRRNTGSQ
jgi:hypothetical protein